MASFHGFSRRLTLLIIGSLTLASAGHAARPPICPAIRPERTSRMPCRRLFLLLAAIGALAGEEPAALGQSAKDFKWTQIASMSQARLGHGLVELPAGPNGLGLSTGAGKVMAIGGFDSSPVAQSVPANPLAACEVFDPTTHSWSPTAPHPVAAGYRWVARLSNGMILVAGGLKDRLTTIPNSHVYDPTSNRWIATRPLPEGVMNPHGFMRAIVLPNGQVLIAGGEDQDSERIYAANGSVVPTRKAFVFTFNDRHPELSSWDYTRNKATGAVSLMPEPKTTSALVLLTNGTVLNVGGFGPPPDGQGKGATNSATVYDPATGLWSSVAPMPPVYGVKEDEFVSSYPTGPGSRWGPYSQVLPDGRVLIAGGMGGKQEVARASVIIYDARTAQWTLSPPMKFRRYVGSWEGALDAGGTFLAAGSGVGQNPRFALQDMAGDLFDVTKGSWSQVPSNGAPPTDGSTDSFESASVVLSNGTLQVAGGEDFITESLAINSSWIFGP